LCGFNDTHWDAIEANAKLLVSIAQAGRVRGICFDPEPYDFSLWDYTKQARTNSHDFAEYRAKVRQRGAQLMCAFETPMSGATILTFFHVSLFDRFASLSESERTERLAREGWGLMPDFFVGMLEGARSQPTRASRNATWPWRRSWPDAGSRRRIAKILALWTRWRGCFLCGARRTRPYLESVLSEPAQAALSQPSTTATQSRQVNRSNSYHALKDQVLDLLYRDIPAPTVINKLMRLFKGRPVALRPNRNVPRRRKPSFHRSYHFQRRVKKTVF
jgi:hypothetical protein